MKKICFVIPDGTGIRNYLYSDLIKYLQNKNCKIVLLHSISDEAIKEINKVHSTTFKTYKLPLYNETRYQKFLRESICYARLIFNKKLVNNSTILTNWRPNTSSFIKIVFYEVVKIIGKYLSKKYNRILKFEKKYSKEIERDCTLQKSLLKSINPDVIFSTHQRTMNAVPLINAAKQLGIKTIGSIFSWDNLPKARLTVRTDKYVVWSKYMKEELELYYPEIDGNAIEVTGTPHFEFYYRKNFIIEKTLFFNKFNLNKNKKIICFSGDDILTSPFDPIFLDDIANGIKKQKLNLQIILRKSPADVSNRFDVVLKKYPTIIKEVPPLWNFNKGGINNWQIIYPTFKDIELLISTVYYSDIVVNIGSTMAHDFAIFDKPAIYLNYNPIDSDKWNVETIYNFQHFRSMKEIDAVGWINNKEEIDFKLNQAIKKPESLGKERQKWLNKIAENRDNSSSKIVEYLIKN